MKRTAVIVLLSAVITCCFCHKSYSSISEIQTFASKSGITESLVGKYALYTSTEQVQDSIKVYTLDSLKLKNPNMAIFYSVVPGIAFHGAGHVYAGKIPTAITLFGCELLSVGLVFLGGVGQIEGENDAGDNAIFIGSLVFFGTWLYDFIGSPMAVNKRNKELLFQKAFGFKLQTKNRNSRLVIVWRF